MEEETGKKDEVNENVSEGKNHKEEIFTRVVRAGKRTYFFDVKATRKEDYYLTITESKKRMGKEGKFFYEKHKLFLYKEDFEKFTEGLKDAVNYINDGRDESQAPIPMEESKKSDEEQKPDTKEFTDVDFDDLGKK